MSNRFWNAVAYTSFAVMFFIVTLVVIRWMISFVDWAGIDSGWASAVGAIVTVPLAVFMAIRERTTAGLDEIAKIAAADAAVIAALRDLANEISSTCGLCSGAPTGIIDGTPLHPDFEAHLGLLAEMVSTIPVDRLAIHGKVRMMFMLHRIALEAKSVLQNGETKDMAYIKKHRNQFMRLCSEANGYATELADIATKLGAKTT